MISLNKIITAFFGLLTAFATICASPIDNDNKNIIKSPYNYWTTKAWGVNLGNWLILEKWMNPSFFEKHAPNATDEWSFCKDASNPTKALNDHWNSWVTEDDFKRLKEVKVNQVRIPVGYWAFIKPDAGEPYVTTGQKEQLKRILGYCDKYGMYAIIDLHGLPGSQNGEMHSGKTGSIDFYSSHNIERSLKTVQAAVDWMNGLEGKLRDRISAIEAANEPHIGGDKDLKDLKNYYQKAYTIISKSKYKVPMMFHDGFAGLDAWNNFLPSTANAIIDLHPYYSFPPEKNQATILKRICDMKSSVESFHLPVFFGEWSLASGVDNSDTWLKKMMDTQVSLFKESGVGGTFWSLKNKINSSVWSLQQLQDEGIVNNRTFSHHPNSQC